MNPVSSRAIAVATFGLAFPFATRRRKRVVSRSWAFQAMSPTTFGKASWAIRVLPPNPRNPLIRPRRFREQVARVRIPRFGDRPAPHPEPRRVFRRHQPEIRHELARLAKAGEVSEFGDQAHRGDERDPA